jgi:preprotein translocase subunit SecA
VGDVSAIGSQHAEQARAAAAGVPGRIHRDLWPALARPAPRGAPPRDIDSFGHWLRGAVIRRKLARLDHARAGRIMEAAGTLVNHSAGAFAQHVECVRERVVLHRQDPAAVDAGFAAAYEAIRRTLGFSLHPVQVLAALVMADGACAELATGEGKTITAILPAALDAWLGKGVHVITVNDYLAQRDAEITSPAYAQLGLTVGFVTDASTPPERRAAYARDITYAADKQVIFDFLRDRLFAPVNPRTSRLLMDALAPSDAPRTEDQAPPDWPDMIVQRGHFSAIVDEADSVLIDEAVTPAIISQTSETGSAASSPEVYAAARDIARGLTAETHFHADVRMRLVRLTREGRARIASAASDPKLPEVFRSARKREELVNQALTAEHLYKRGDDYIVADEKVAIVDRSTGRVLEGRQWQMGLHQAIEAKESAKITPERRTSTRSSYQNYFKLYRRLSGMTGTGWEVRSELFRYYKLPVARVPTHRPVIRRHEPDQIFPTAEAKYIAVTRRVAELHARGQPVLVGTRSVAASEHLGELLAREGLACSILNANREREEAAIIELAGRAGAITVATNMAGRGTDIRLDEAARAAGGLAVIATERHEESRVDRQLFGRAGRQGDPGLAQAFVSYQDDLILRSAPHTLTALARAALASGRIAPSRLLWRITQLISGKHSSMIRAETFKAEAWLDMALHHHIR